MGAMTRTALLRPAALAIAVAIAMLALPGCGGDDSEPMPRPQETLDRPAPLPPGWRTAVDRAAGFSIGVPQGWAVKQRGSRTVVRSPDGLAAVSVAADRTDEALELPLRRYAVQAANALGDEGFEALRVGDPERLEGRYEGAVVKARGTQGKTDVDQRIEVIVLRRRGIAVYAILVALSAAQDPELHSPELESIVRSLRGRPPELGA
jgi:hypothetical protein